MIFKKDDDRKITKVPKTWTSNGSGAATMDLGDYKGYEIVACQSVPGANGDRTTDCPATTYTLTLVDEFAMDWFFGEGATRSVSVAEAFCKDGVIPISDTSTITIAGAGDTKQGLINVWIA